MEEKKRDRMVIGSIIIGIIVCISAICLADEKQELETKLAYYGEVIRRAQYEVMIATQEADKVKVRLNELSQAEEYKKREEQKKKEEVKK